MEDYNNRASIQIKDKILGSDYASVKNCVEYGFTFREVQMRIVDGKDYIDQVPVTLISADVHAQRQS